MAISNQKYVDATLGDALNAGTSPTAALPISGATWTDLSKRIEAPGHGYTFNPGDALVVTGGAGGTPGTITEIVSVSGDFIFVVDGGLWNNQATDCAFNINGPWTLDQAALNVVPGDVVNIKAGTYPRTAQWTVANAGSKTAPIIWRGYSSNPGDADRPVVVIDGQGNDITLLSNSGGGNYNIFEFIHCQSNDPAMVRTGLLLSGASSLVRRCRVTEVGGIGIQLGAVGSAAIECEVADWSKENVVGQAGIRLAGSGTLARTCYVHDALTTGARGIESAHADARGALHCLVDTVAAAAFELSVGGAAPPVAVFENCVAYNAGGDGFRASATLDPGVVSAHRCLAVANGGWGLSASGNKAFAVVDACGFYGNTSGEVDDVNMPGALLIGNVSLGADPFTDAANRDFNVSTSDGLGRGATGTFLINGAPTRFVNSPAARIATLTGGTQ